MRHLYQHLWRKTDSSWEETFSTYTCCFEYTGQTSFINSSPKWVLLGALCQLLSWSLWQIHVGSWVKMVLHKPVLWILSLSVGRCLPAGGDLPFMEHLVKSGGTFDRHNWEDETGIWKVERGQGCCSTSCNAQDSSPDQRITRFRRPVVPQLRNPAGDSRGEDSGMKVHRAELKPKFPHLKMRIILVSVC